jgi:hypothetical protein
MDIGNLTGYYTYRSFLNKPLPVNDFNQIKFAEDELFLVMKFDGTFTGWLSFPAESNANKKQFMDIQEGKTIFEKSRTILEFTARGRPNTSIFDYEYEYSGTVTHNWKNGSKQRLCLTGTELRSKNHGTGDRIAKAGETASFVAVKKEFPEPKDIAEIKIIPQALAMLSSRSHRLKHAVWHTLRTQGLWDIRLKESDQIRIRDLGWGLDRPPFKGGILDLGNGAGEDFLFMHRKMIAMVKDIYNSQGVAPIAGWKSIPRPFEEKYFTNDPNEFALRIDTSQFYYTEVEDASNAGRKTYQLDMSKSGNMMPPPTIVPSNNMEDDPNVKEQDLRSLRSTQFLKSDEYFGSTMLRLEQLFKDKIFLSSISLGALGNLIEFRIHNQMHGRWSSVSINPLTNMPETRDPFDIDEKWDDPKYDYLGEFYSSHVNPIFWRLHGWVDDRIEDWYNAHEETHQGEIERIQYKEVAWFKPGKWVKVSNPFYWPEHSHSDHHSSELEQKDIKNMEEVIEIIKNTIRPAARTISRIKFHDDSNLMRFIHDISSLD